MTFHQWEGNLVEHAFVESVGATSLQAKLSDVKWLHRPTSCLPTLRSGPGVVRVHSTGNPWQLHTACERSGTFPWPRPHRQCLHEQTANR